MGIIIGLFVEFLLTANPKSTFLKKGYLIMVGATFILALRYGFERTKLFENHTRNKLLKKEFINTNYPPKSVLFDSPHSIEWMFYNDVLAYPKRPKESIVDSLIQKGWSVF